MAIQINGTTVINNNRRALAINNIQFADGTVQSTANLDAAKLGENVGTAGALIFTLNNPGTNVILNSNNDYFGDPVAIDGNYAIVGAPEEDDASGDSSGKAYIFDITTGALIRTLNNPNAYDTASGDLFGNSVAISGNYAIVGAQYEDIVGGTSSGKVYVFNVTTGQLLWTLNNPNAYSTSSGDRFGNSVAVSGNYAIVGAYFESDASGATSGKAYIFNVTTGQLAWILDNPNLYGTSANDQFGNSVSISGNYAIVGASSEDDASGLGSGKAYIFDVTTGQLLWTLDNPNAYSTSALDYFGFSVAVSGNYAIVGAYQEGDTGGAYSGKAYIYNVTTGTLLFTLNNPSAYSTGADDNFGESVSISDNYAIVGASFESDAGGFSSGKAYIFDVTTGQLLWTLNNPNAYSTSANDRFGNRVAISGDYAIVGVWGEGDTSGNRSGKVYTFSASSGVYLKTIDNPNVYGATIYDRFGNSVSISGNYAIVGAWTESDATGFNSGKAYIFNVTTGQLLWTLDNPNAYSTGANDNFGQSVAISGNYAIVSAPGEAEAGGGITSGKAYIYNVTNGAVLWTLNNPNAYSTSLNDNFGWAVAISGNYAIVNAWGEDDAGGTYSGKAYIYNVTTGQLVWTLNNPNAYSTSLNDYFGYSVAVSGNYAIVGAHEEDDARGTSSGKAYIYNVTTGQLVWTLNNPNIYGTGISDRFGFSVAVSGNYAIVGAYQEDEGQTVSQSGKAYIYNVTNGALLWTLNNPNAYSTGLNDEFGSRVAISGNYAIVSAYNEDDASGTSSGKAYIYNVTTGALIRTLNNPSAYSTGNGDQFGNSVAVSGNYAIVGVQTEDDVGGVDSGKAYIFQISQAVDSAYVEEINFSSGASLNLLTHKAFQVAHPAGGLVWTLDNPNAYSTSFNDQFGYSSAISGNYAIVGAFQEVAPYGLDFLYDSGTAYIYNVATGQLLHTLINPNPLIPNIYDTDYFGYSVAISGNYAIVGAYTEYNAAGSTNSGKAYIFNVTTGQLLWTLDNPNAYSTSAGDQFGYSVAISGNYAIVGAWQEDDASGTSSGKAYIFNVTTGALLWTLTNPNAYSTSANDGFGASVAISGNYAIVSASYEDDVRGFSSGKAYIFNVTTGALVWTLNNPNAYSSGGYDGFGVSVAISGNYAIVGSFEDDASGQNSGKAYIFNVTTGQLVWTLNNPNAYGTGNGDQFGTVVAISGNYAIVGAYYEDDAGGTESGKAYIFDITTGQLICTLDNPNAYDFAGSDVFGWSVAISGNYAIVGAYQEDDASGSGSGKSYIFSITDQTYLDKILTVSQSIF